MDLTSDALLRGALDLRTATQEDIDHRNGFSDTKDTHATYTAQLAARQHHLLGMRCDVQPKVWERPRCPRSQCL
jgi:hypothetical protein